MRHYRAFTLVELLIVVTIIGVLAALLLPAVQAAREAGRRTQCSNNLHQIVLGLHNYETSYRTYPPGFISQVTTAWTPAMGNNAGAIEIGPGWGVQALALPFLEQAPLHATINFSLPITDSSNQSARSKSVSVYRCPSDSWNEPVSVWPAALSLNDLAPNSYIVCLGGGDPASAPNYSAIYEELPFNGMFHRNTSIRHAQVTDGTSNTIGFGERASMFAPNGWVGVVPGASTVFSPWMAAQRGQAVGATTRPALTMATLHVRTGAPNQRDQHQTTDKIFSVGTIGSLLGNFAAAFWLIPTLNIELDRARQDSFQAKSSSQLVPPLSDSRLRRDRADEVVGQDMGPQFLAHQFRSLASQHVHVLRPLHVWLGVANGTASGQTLDCGTDLRLAGEILHCRSLHPRRLATLRFPQLYSLHAGVTQW